MLREPLVGKLCDSVRGWRPLGLRATSAVRVVADPIRLSQKSGIGRPIRSGVESGHGTTQSQRGAGPSLDDGGGRPRSGPNDARRELKQRMMSGKLRKTKSQDQSCPNMPAVKIMKLTKRLSATVSYIFDPRSETQGFHPSLPYTNHTPDPRAERNPPTMPRRLHRTTADWRVATPISRIVHLCTSVSTTRQASHVTWGGREATRAHRRPTGRHGSTTFESGGQSRRASTLASAHATAPCTSTVTPAAATGERIGIRAPVRGSSRDVSPSVRGSFQSS